MVLSQHEEFTREVAQNVDRMAADPVMAQTSRQWLELASEHRYSHNFTWMGRPIIQVPQDIQALQEIVWRCRPDLIVETGIAHGGSLILSASLLALLELADAAEAGGTMDPSSPHRRVVGVDIDIRIHNRSAIESHPMASRIHMIEGSSIEPDVVTKVHAMAAGCSSVLVLLDSNHTHAHVLAELEAYAPVVTVGSYCVVYDTAIEHMPDSMFPNRPWASSNSPLSAVREFLTGRDDFVLDDTIERRLQITVAPGGYLRRVR